MGLDPSAIEALLFDLDGTLLDSDDEGVEALARWLERLRVRDARYRARRIVMRMETPVNALMTALDVVGLDTPLLGFSEWLRHRRHRTTPRFRIVPGAEEALRLLARSYRLAVVTTRGRKDAQTFLESFASPTSLRQSLPASPPGGSSPMRRPFATRPGGWTSRPTAARWWATPRWTCAPPDRRGPGPSASSVDSAKRTNWNGPVPT